MEIQPTHTCFDDALDYITMEVKRNPFAFQPSRYRVVHAVCLWPEGDKLFVHAWVEQGDEAVGCGLMDGMRVYYFTPRRELYRAFRPQEMVRYTLREVLANNHRTYSYGPWEPYYRQLCKEDR